MSNEAQTYVASLKVGDLTSKFVLSRLADRADERFSCFPSVALLAAEAEKSERVVQRALAKLREMKLISDKERIRADGSTASSRYFLHGPWDNYGGTGVPFPTITTPQQKRAEQWAEPPREGSFRAGTAAAEALAGTSGAAEAQGDEAPAPTAEHKEGRGDTGHDAPAAPAPKETGEAPRKSSTPKKAGKSQVRMTKAQAAAVATVETAWPAELAELLPKYRPDVIRDAILQALDSRTPEQLAERVRRRWWAHGYAVDATPEGKGLGSPVGVAVGLLRPSTDCPDPMCEDGTTLDTGAACRACAERRADRKADRRGGTVPAPRAEHRAGAQDRWECAECRDPYRGERPADGLCSDCRADAEAAAAAARRLQEDFEQAEAERARLAAEAWDVMLEDAHAEHAEREQAAAELRAQQEAAEQRRRQEEEETRRLREQLAREHPELAALSQS